MSCGNYDENTVYLINYNSLKYLLCEVGVSISKAGNFVVFHRHVFLALSHQAQALQVCILHQGNLKSQNITDKHHDNDT